MEFLTDVKDQKIKSITISIRLDALTDQLASEMLSVFERNQGQTEVYFQVIDHTKQVSLLLQTRTFKLNVERSLLDFLDSENALEYKIN